MLGLLAALKVDCNTATLEHNSLSTVISENIQMQQNKYLARKKNMPLPISKSLRVVKLTP